MLNIILVKDGVLNTISPRWANPISERRKDSPRRQFYPRVLVQEHMNNVIQK